MYCLPLLSLVFLPFFHITAADQLPVQLLMHLDLKGAPPKVSYLRKLFPFLKDLGIRGLLIEYEDMFPYQHPLVRPIATASAYTLTELRTILSMSKAHGLSVIPLVQMFGHLEHVLKLPQFHHMSEIPHHGYSICPSRCKAIELLKTILDEIASLHYDAQYVHIGCDEVFAMRKCLMCRKKAAPSGRREEHHIFLEHVLTMARYLKDTHGKQAIVWDDMLRQIPESDIAASGITEYVDIMVWEYTTNVSALSNVWDKYSKLFKKQAWIATAFKGADGRSRKYPVLNKRLANHAGWNKFIQRSTSGWNITGLVLTGWARYTHTMPLCELLPVGLPSLVLCAMYLLVGTRTSDPRQMAVEKASEFLKCPLLLNVTAVQGENCQFPGVEIVRGIAYLEKLKQEVDDAFSAPKCTGNRRHTCVHMEEYYLSRSASLESQLTDDLSAIFSPYTVHEWMASNVQPLFIALRSYTVGRVDTKHQVHSA
ncbi:hexosaminidase D-like isoform X2 [Ornithodoros turicata]|uniref:hexosaminidase D-like isoform X2 n=1 Tax=Ornithodoros turicata TaxID=34597 RepID=UPI003139EFB0